MSDDDLEPVAAEYRKWVWLAAEVWDALRGTHIPEGIAGDLLVAWMTSESE